MILREMLVDDLDQVMEIEEELFSVPWTKEGFLTFLMKENAMFLVVEEKGRILGYCGLLTVLDEGDVTNVAVRRDRQREGIGNFLMESMIRLARYPSFFIYDIGRFLGFFFLKKRFALFFLPLLTFSLLG